MGCIEPPLFILKEETQTFRILSSTAVVALVAGPSFAQELTFGRGNFDYSSFNVDGTEELTTSRLDAEAEMTFNQILLGGYFSNDTFDPSGIGELSIQTYGLSGAYMLTPEALVGLGLTGIRFESGGSDDSISGFEAFGQYRTGQFGAALTISRPDADDADDFTIYTAVAEAEVTTGVTLGAVYETFTEDDVSVYVLSAEYEQGPIFGRAYVLGTNSDFGNDATAVGLRGSYEFTDSIRALAAYEKFDFDSGADETTGFSVGAGYRIVDGVWFDASLGQLEEGGEAADVINVNISYEFGTRTRLDRQVKQDLMEDSRAGARSLVPDFGYGIIGLVIGS